MITNQHFPIVDICLLLRAVPHSFEVTGRYLPKILMGRSHLFLVTVADTTVSPEYELTAQQSQSD
jgi:hypothetical protein